MKKTLLFLWFNFLKIFPSVFFVLHSFNSFKYSQLFSYYFLLLLLLIIIYICQLLFLPSIPTVFFLLFSFGACRRFVSSSGRKLWLKWMDLYIFKIYLFCVWWERTVAKNIYVRTYICKSSDFTMQWKHQLNLYDSRIIHKIVLDFEC